MKIFALLIFCFFAITASAQLEDLTGKLDAHIGYASKIGNSFPIGSGPAFNIEPKVWYNEELVFGAKLGLNFLSSPVSNQTLAPLANVMLVGEKYFGEGDLLFFVGGSAGLYVGGQTKKINGVKITNTKASQQWGLAPRAGLQFGQYRLMAEYNMRKGLGKFLTIMIGYNFGSQ
jgi:hypothetical protein